MFIGLRELELQSVRFDVDVSPGEIDFDDQLTQDSVLHAEGTAQLVSQSLGEIRVHGDLKATMRATCDRCLEPAKFPVASHFDLVYLPSAGAARGGENEVDEAAVEVGYYEGSGLDLNDILREVVLLAVPMQLVCSEDCKGICPLCGQNRNQQDCGCHPESVDDRWSKLKAFRSEVGRESRH